MSPASGSAPPKPGEGPLKLDAMEVYVEPEPCGSRSTTRPGASSVTSSTTRTIHGLDLDKAKKKYAPYLDGIASREELTYLFEECLGEMTVGHMFVGRRRSPEPKKVKGGLLGADYAWRTAAIASPSLRRRELEPRACRLP